MTTYQPFAKSVEDKPHTALGAADIANIQDQQLAVPCTHIQMDEYFTGKTYPTSEPLTTLHGLIKAIQAIITQQNHKQVAQTLQDCMAQAAVWYETNIIRHLGN